MHLTTLTFCVAFLVLPDNTVASRVVQEAEAAQHNEKGNSGRRRRRRFSWTDEDDEEDWTIQSTKKTRRPTRGTLAGRTKEAIGNTNVGGKTTRLVMLSTNDVYKMIGRSNDVKGWSWEGTLDGQVEFLNKCEANPEGCFPTAAVQHLKMRDQPLETIRLKRMVGGPTYPLMDEDHLGCAKRLADMRAEGVKFGNLLDYGKSVQLRRRVWAAANGSTTFLNVLQGDFLGPSYLATLNKGKHTVALMNEIGTDLVAFGNHDFDFHKKCGSAGDELCIVKRMQHSNFLWFGANVYHQDDTSLRLGASLDVASKSVAYRVGNATKKVPRNKIFASGTKYNPRYWTVNIGARKICVFGTTEKVSADGSARHRGVEFTDANTVGIEVLKELQSTSCSLIVALTHQRTGDDINLWRKAVQAGLRPPDVIWGAHDHYAAFLHIENPNDASQMTRIWKMGADAHLLGEMVLEETGPPTFALVPVLENRCSTDPTEFCSAVPTWGKGCLTWFSDYSQTFATFAGPALKMKEAPLPILFRGLYDTANVRIRESRASNMLTDLLRISVDADIGYLIGGNIRQDTFDPKPPQGEALTELDIMEEFPIPNGLAVIEITLMQVYGLMKFAAETHSSPGLDARKAHVSGLTATWDDRGLLDIIFEGPCHIGGLVDRRGAQTNRAAPFPCGALLWSRQTMFKYDPVQTKLKIGAADYTMLVGKEVLILRLSADLAEVETQCFHEGMDTAFSIVLDAEVACVDDKPIVDYYVRLGTVMKWEDCGRDNHIADCWVELGQVSGWATARRKILQWRRKGQVPSKLEDRKQAILADGAMYSALISTMVKKAAVEVNWIVGGENASDLQQLGIEPKEILLLAHDNLPVQRFVPNSIKQKQERLHDVMIAARKAASPKLDAQVAAEIRLFLLRELEKEEQLEEHVSSEVERMVQLLDGLYEASTSQIQQVSSSLLQSHAHGLCRAALWSGLSLDASNDGRVFHRDVGGFCEFEGYT